MRALRGWLFLCCGLVFVMVSVGAVTRLSDAGLSIVEWRPLMGTIPPLNDREWSRAFDLYKAYPEFKQKHFWMSLDDFKRIFFWEWLHRFLGRLIGIAYALPLALFWARGLIPPGYKWRLAGIFLLGALQGAAGWYMVKSGLIQRPDVSHYRLAVHLALAFLIFGLMFWHALSLGGKSPPRKEETRSLFFHACLALAVFVLTIFWGAFTAGLDAGLVYNDTFPKMGNSWLPPDFWTRQPPWINFFENPSGVQLIHRWLALTTVLAVSSLWLRATLRGSASPALHGLAFMAFLQAGLGVSTLFSHVMTPLAVLHQAGALVLLALLVAVLHRLRNSIRV